MTDLWPGLIVWVELGASLGREQSGRRPAVVVSTHAHLAGAQTLVSVVPCTTRRRDWPNHVELDGSPQLALPTFAMTEQLRTISRLRVHELGGSLSAECLRTISRWVSAWHVPAL